MAAPVWVVRATPQLKCCPLSCRSLSTPEKMQQVQDDLVDNMVIAATDFEHALNRIHPSCSQEDIKRHQEFANTYGAT